MSLILPRRRLIERVPLIAPAPFLLQGRFKVELIDAATGRVKRKLKFNNLITNAALDALFTTAITTMITYAGVGTGSTAPTNADTTLQTEITPTSSNRTSNNGGIASSDAYTAGPPDYWTHTQTYLFTETQANGNLTEIGLFSASTGGTMWTRQLLKDGTGTPTVITKTNTDQLRITYTLRTYPPTADVTGVVNISGTNYNYTIRAASASLSPWGLGIIAGGPAYGKNQAATAYSGALGVRTSLPTGTATDASSTSVAAYVAGNYYMDMTYVWDTSYANYGAGGIPAISFYKSASYGANFQCGFAAALPKDNTKRLTLVFRISWNRYP